MTADSCNPGHASSTHARPRGDAQQGMTSNGPASSLPGVVAHRARESGGIDRDWSRDDRAPREPRGQREEREAREAREHRSSGHWDRRPNKDRRHGYSWDHDRRGRDLKEQRDGRDERGSRDDHESSSRRERKDHGESHSRHHHHYHSRSRSRSRSRNRERHDGRPTTARSGRRDDGGDDEARFGKHRSSRDGNALPLPVSSLPAKRHRSPSPSSRDPGSTAHTSQTKRSRRDRSPVYHRHGSRSPFRECRPKSKHKPRDGPGSGDNDGAAASRYHHSRSPGWSDAGDDTHWSRRRPHSRQTPSDTHSRRDGSPGSATRRRSSLTPLRSSSSRGQGRDHSRERSWDRGRERSRERRGSSPRSRKKDRRRSRSGNSASAVSDIASISNSGDADMDGRGRGYRGSGGGGGDRYGAYPAKDQPHQRHQKPHAHDARPYPPQPHFHQRPQSSDHDTPNTSFHGSPPPKSPHDSHQQLSPDARHPTPQGPGVGSSGSSLPPPSGPAQQYHQYRGNKLGSGRGGQRISAGCIPTGPRAGADADVYRSSPMAISPSSADHHHHHEGADVPMPDRDNGVLEHQQSQRPNAGDPMPPPSRQLPTGPQSKFSFAFKMTSKPNVAAPKAEIAQKFNAAPSRPQQLPRSPQRNSNEQALQEHDRQRRALPHNVPTEPASARSRPEHQYQQRQRGDQHQQHQPHRQQDNGSGPRYRKVIKTIRRPKPRPTLPEELAQSSSVYYRKPGNESVVGSGTYGKVFKAVHVYTKKLVALKRIRMEGEREGLPVTAIREIKLLQSLKNINVVELLEVMVERNDCFMVFEYMSHDLTGLLNHPTFTLDAAQKKHLARQLFQGLDYLHRRSVLHRDIKAANILVSSDGILKLADFGLARFFAKRHQLDYTNRVITIWYRSPELLLGETQYGPAVDIWSAACVLVEIFARRAVFPGEGGELRQLDKIYSVLGTPSKSDWPGLVDMPWFELMRPAYRRPNVFAEAYQHRVTPAAFDLLTAMFRYDPAKRPTAAEVLEHPYFCQEEPAPRQAVELASIEGDWHEFESKALRRENDRKEKEAKKAEAAAAAKAREASAVAAATAAIAASARRANPVDPDNEAKKRLLPDTASVSTLFRPGPDGQKNPGVVGNGSLDDGTRGDDGLSQPAAKRLHLDERPSEDHENTAGDNQKNA